jgi:hypothetical protein
LISTCVANTCCASRAEIPTYVKRVKKARPKRRWGDDWFSYRQWIGFFAARCSRKFIEVYLESDPGLIDRCLTSIGSDLAAMPELRLLARFHALNILSEDQRQRLLSTVSELSVETPDADWLNSKPLRVIQGTGTLCEVYPVGGVAP